jgi:uncharacterized membrane protein YraQ (UPF0718 family)
LFVLSLSLLALVVGPLVTYVARSSRTLLDVLDGFVVVAIVGIVVIHVMPHAFAEIGAWSIVPLVIGLVLPKWLERARGEALTGPAFAAFVVCGLAVHALLDGTALNTHEGHAHAHAHPHGEVLATAVSLHRVPEGLAVWWLLAPRRGARWAAAALVFIGLCSVAGFLLSEALVDRLPERAMVALEAVIAGSLLHVVAHHELASPEAAHHHGGAHVHDSQSLAGGVGAVVGCVFLALVTRNHPVAGRVARELGFSTTLRALALSMALPLAVALIASSILHAMPWPRFATRSSEANPSAVRRIALAARGVVLGALLPVCSCGVRPFYAERAGSGPDSTSLALLVSAPEMELASFLLTAVLISPAFALARLGCIAVVAIVAGTALGRGRSTIESHRRERGDLREGVRFALGETVEHTGPWIVFGLLAAALVEPFLAPDAFAHIPAPLLIVAVTALGALVPMCASGVTPLLAVLIHKGLPLGAALAFVIAAAAATLRTQRLLRTLHGDGYARRHIALVAGLALILGACVHLASPRPFDSPLHALAEAVPSLTSIACLVFLGGALLTALLRRGPRSLLLELLREHWRRRRV